MPTLDSVIKSNVGMHKTASKIRIPSQIALQALKTATISATKTLIQILNTPRAPDVIIYSLQTTLPKAPKTVNGTLIKQYQTSSYRS